MQRNSSARNVLLYGIHAVNAALNNPKRQHKTLYVTDDLVAEYASYGKLLRVVTKKELDKLLPENAVHQGVALETSLLPDVFLEDLPLDQDRVMLLAFDQVTDPHNVGAILRSAACFKVDGAVHTDRNCPPETGVLAKSACGALELVPFAKVTNLARTLDDLKEKGFWVVGLSEHGQEYIHAIDLPNKIVLIVGSEGSGMRRLVMEKCDFLTKLPTNPVFPTLNASNAAAIAMYEIQRHLGRNQ